MATQRAIPGANVPESGTSTARKGRSGADEGQTRSLSTELPGETGLGSGLGSTTSGFGAGEGYGTSGASTAASTGTSGSSTSSSATREFPLDDKDFVQF